MAGNFSMVMPQDLRRALDKKAAETGMTVSDIARMAIATFLAQEDQIDTFLQALEPIARQLGILTQRQELFTRSLANAALVADRDKVSPEVRQKLFDRLSQIVDDTNKTEG